MNTLLKQKKEWMNFLTEECFDLEMYKHGKYDLKMWNWIKKAIKEEGEKGYKTWTMVERNKDVLSGRLVFRGTRVPVKLILKYLANGWSIEDIKKSYPTVKSQDISRLLLTFSKFIDKMCS